MIIKFSYGIMFIYIEIYVQLAGIRSQITLLIFLYYGCMIPIICT